MKRRKFMHSPDPGADMHGRLLPGIAALLLSVAACGGGAVDDAPQAAAGTDAAGPGKPASADEGASGKPSAPITIGYEVLGAAFVGQPVSIEVDVRSTLTDQPLTMSYHINDADSMQFPESQPQRVALRIPAEEGRAARQVTVVPQREGRLYLNVTAEYETAKGTMMKSIAIPVAVGRAPDTEPEVNGTLREGPGGESVVSMPAREN